MHDASGGDPASRFQRIADARIRCCCLDIQKLPQHMSTRILGGTTLVPTISKTNELGAHMDTKGQTRSYIRDECITFRKTEEEFGGLSNMATGYEIELNGMKIGTSEALYQACRFPFSAEVQEMIIEQKSPMTAKMKSKPFRSETRPDWEDVRIPIMRWCIRAKLACNWVKFGELLLATGKKDIVEDSHRDRFWGAVATEEGDRLVGINALGRLLMELREVFAGPNRKELAFVEPPRVKDFLLLGSVIGEIKAKDSAVELGEKVFGRPRNLFDMMK